MVFTIHRYVFRELFRAFLLAATALTLILSLGSILRPVQEYGIGPGQVIHLLGYFMPITLTFVLPLAALFACALIYGRFAGDNELDACRASGISLLTLVYPGLTLAIMITIANLILSFYVTPAFIRRAEKAVKADARQILFRNIQQRGYYKIPPDERYRIYADYADTENDVLAGVIVAERKGAGIARLITAESARVKFEMHDRLNEVEIIAHNTYQMGSANESGFSSEWLSIATEFGSLINDDVKFKKIDEMKKIRLDPMRFVPVERLARQAYAQLNTELLAQDIADAKTKDPNGFYKLYSNEKLIEVSASNSHVSGERNIGLYGEVTVSEYLAGSSKIINKFKCSDATLLIEGDEIAPTITIELINASWTQPDGLEGLTRRHIIRGLVMPKSVSGRFNDTDILKTVSVQNTDPLLRNKPSGEMRDLQERLDSKIHATIVRIDTEVHSRLVFGLGCIPMILIGIGLGIIQRGGHLLSAFGSSCIPAVVMVIFIMMGRNVAYNDSSIAQAGIPLMWAGLAVLLSLMAMLYKKLLSN